MYPNNNRSTERFPASLSINLMFGTQITLKGQIRDLSLKSAFILVRSSISMDVNDGLSFSIENPNNAEASIQGSATISRVSIGEGIAIYFTKMDEESTNHLQLLTGLKV